MPEFYCDCCGQQITPKDQRYLVRLELWAAPDPLVVSADDLKRNFKKEMEELIRQMEKQDATELTHQVWVRYDFDLCPRCRQTYYELLQRPRPLAPQKDLEILR